MVTLIKTGNYFELFCDESILTSFAVLSIKCDSFAHATVILWSNAHMIEDFYLFIYSS